MFSILPLLAISSLWFKKIYLSTETLFLNAVLLTNSIKVQV